MAAVGDGLLKHCCAMGSSMHCWFALETGIEFFTDMVTFCTFALSYSNCKLKAHSVENWEVLLGQLYSSCKYLNIV